MIYFSNKVIRGDYMFGWLVVNGFLNSNKFNEIYSWLKTAFEKRGHILKVYTNIELINIDNKQRPDFVLFWDKDILLAKQLEKMGLRLFNNSNAIEICDNKALTYIFLKDKVKMPKTIIGPMTYRNIGYTVDFLDSIDLGYPMVIKECCGSFGQQVYLAENVQQASEIISNTNEPILFQEYISESRGKDIRINVVGDKVVASMLRYNDNDFRANITNGGSMLPYEPSDEEAELAIKTCKLLNLDFGGVDILFGNDGPILCEVNSNAHFKNIYDCTNINVADYIAEYVEKHMLTE